MKRQDRQIKFLLPAICIVVLTLLTGITSSIYAQQKPQFTQYMFNSLVLNPAYAGAENALSATLFNRNQWTNVEGAPQTQTLSVHTRINEKRVGLGITATNDKIGVHKNLYAAGNFAYHLPVSEKSTLSFGMLAGIKNSKSDYNSVNAGNRTDPKIAGAYQSQTFVDAGAGIFFHSPDFQLSLSSPHLLKHDMIISDTLTTSPETAQYLLFSRYTFTLSTFIQIQPGFLIKYLRGIPVSYDLNANVIFGKAITTGLSYRKTESVAFLLRAQLTPQLQFGYGFDYPVSYNATLSNGSHEFMVNYVFHFMKSNITSPR